MNPAWWTILGIAPTDDVRSVKRAYATRLKACRPEDDPQAFAQLREAYDAVLSRLKSAAKEPVAYAAGAHLAHAKLTSAVHEERVEQSAAGRKLAEDASQVVDKAAPAAIVRPLPTMPGAPRAPLPPPATRLAPDVSTTVAHPSPQQVAANILAQTKDRDGRWSGFAIWLHGHDALISLDFKAATSEALLRKIAAEGAPRREAIEVLAQFFGWDDYRKPGAPHVASMLVTQVQQRVSKDEFAKWLDAPGNQKNSAARTLRTVRKFGGGKRAWMMASLLINRSRIARSFRAVTSTYGEAALPAVLGEKATRFWYRALAPMPNLLQMALTIPMAAVSAILIATLLLTDTSNAPMVALIGLWTAMLLAAALFCTDWFGIALRSWQLRWHPAIRRRLHALAQVLRLEKVPREAWGAMVLAVLGVAGWTWPPSFPDWPFYTLVLLMSLGAFKERRVIYGCAMAALGACALSKLFFDNGKVPFLALPATLWLGRWLHQRWTQAFPRSKARQETVILIVGVTIGLTCFVLAGWRLG